MMQTRAWCPRLCILRPGDHPMRLSVFLLALSLFVSSAWAAPRIELVGAMPGMAVLRIGGAAQRTVRVGQSTPDGVKLLTVSGDTATVEVGGERLRLVLGQGSVGGGESGGGQRREVLTANGQGHFVTTILVNGRTVQAVLDTGATSVSMNQATARQIGLNYLNGTRGAVSTANGIANSWKVRLDSVSVGTITLYQVDATVVESDLPIVLLGMSFLSRVEMHRSNEQMELIQH